MKKNEDESPPTLDFDCVPTVNPSERNVYYYLHENERYLHESESILSKSK